MKTERQIKKEIKARAMKMASDAYEKEVMFTALQAGDLNYAIMEDLIQAANMTGSVVIKWRDGTTATIKGKDERAELNNGTQLY